MQGSTASTGHEVTTTEEEDENIRTLFRQIKDKTYR